MKKRIRILLLTCMVLLTGLVSLGYFPETAKAAEGYDYTNAKTFWEQTEASSREQISKNHAVFKDPYIYYATNAKLSSTGTNLRYACVGWSITVYSPGGSMFIDVARDGSYIEDIKSASVTTTKREYHLYRVKFDTIADLCRAKNKALADSMFQYDFFSIKMDAIMTVKKPNTTAKIGTVTDNGNGTVSESGAGYTWNGTYFPRVSYFRDQSQWAPFKVFGTDAMNSYKNIEQDVPLSHMNIYYKVGDLAKAPNSSYMVTTDGYLTFTGGNRYLQ